MGLAGGAGGLPAGYANDPKSPLYGLDERALSGGVFANLNLGEKTRNCWVFVRFVRLFRRISGFPLFPPHP